MVNSSLVWNIKWSSSQWIGFCGNDPLEYFLCQRDVDFILMNIRSRWVDRREFSPYLHHVKFIAINSVSLNWSFTILACSRSSGIFHNPFRFLELIVSNSLIFNAKVNLSRSIHFRSVNHRWSSLLYAVFENTVINSIECSWKSLFLSSRTSDRTTRDRLKCLHLSRAASIFLKEKSDSTKLRRLSWIDRREFFARWVRQNKSISTVFN